MMNSLRFFLLLGLLAAAAPISAQDEAEAVPSQEISQSEPEALPVEAVAEAESQSAADSIEAEAEHAEQMMEMELNRRSRSIVQFGTDVHVLPGDTVSEVVVIGGSLLVEGRVLRNVVVVGGNVELGANATVGWDMVNVLGTTTIGQGASIGRELVVVGGRLEAPLQFRAGRSQNVVSLPGGLQAFAAGIFPWMTGGLMWGRVVVPGLPWMWGIIGIVSLVYLSIGFLFPAAVARVGAPLEERPLSTFLVGIAALFLLVPVVFFLAVSVVGIIVIPFFIAAYLTAVLFGRVAVSRRLGGLVLPESEPGNRIQVLRSLLIGMAILLLAYMVPLLGIIAWMFVGVFGLGGAALATLASLRKENPIREKPAPETPPIPAPGVGGVSSEPGYASAGFSAGPEEDYSGGNPPPYPLPSLSSPRSEGLLAFPRAPFLDRIGAFLVDLILVGILVITIERGGGQFRFFAIAFLIYSIGFWAWKGATVGGILLGLRVVRTSGEVIDFGGAVVRGFAGILSLAPAGLGFLWIVWDAERQGWHDRIAGTYVVKVPRNYPV